MTEGSMLANNAGELLSFSASSNVDIAEQHWLAARLESVSASWARRKKVSANRWHSPCAYGGMRRAKLSISTSSDVTSSSLPTWSAKVCVCMNVCMFVYRYVRMVRERRERRACVRARARSCA